MRRDELDAWLGDFADTLSDAQKDDLLAVYATLEERYPDEDDERRTAGLTAASQVAFGDTTLREVADAWRAARLAEREAMAALTGAVLMAEWSAPEYGRVTEATIVSATGVNRQTVRKMLGKQ